MRTKPGLRKKLMLSDMFEGQDVEVECIETGKKWKGRITETQKSPPKFIDGKPVRGIKIRKLTIKCDNGENLIIPHGLMHEYRIYKA